MIGNAVNKSEFLRPNFSMTHKNETFPTKPPMQINETNKDACSSVIGPEGNLVFGDCSSIRFAFAQAQFQPNAKFSRFAEHFKAELLSLE